MKLTLRMTLYAGAVFAIVCFAVAVTAFLSLRDVTDAVQEADTRGFAWFWAFLGAVSAAFAGLAWWITRSQPAEDAES